MRAAVLALGLALPAGAYETFVLPNGLRVLLDPDPSVPVVTVAMAVPVGSRQETPGRSGFAHLFEHLMFQGSAHVPRGQFDKLLEGLGGDNNASTHEDHTFYHETLPAHALATALWLDADRLSALAVSEEGLRNQVSVVEEERRQNVDDEPYQPLLSVEVASRVFANWANAHDTFGSFADLDAAKRADAQAFFDARYAPRETRLAVVGDFSLAEGRALVERYFAWIPGRAAASAPAPVDASEPAQTGERRFTSRDEHAAVPGVALVWTGTPPRAGRERWALGLVGRYLGAGDAARLRQVLVKEARAATAVDQPAEGGLGFPVTGLEDYKEPGAFGFFILRRPEASPERVRELVLAETARAAAEGVPEPALSRVKARLKGDWLRGRQTGLGRAQAWLRAAVLDGDPAAADAEILAAMSITPEETRAAAAALFRDDHLNVFTLEAGSR